MPWNTGEGVNAPVSGALYGHIVSIRCRYWHALINIIMFELIVHYTDGSRDYEFFYGIDEARATARAFIVQNNVGKVSIVYP